LGPSWLDAVLPATDRAWQRASDSARSESTEALRASNRDTTDTDDMIVSLQTPQVANPVWSRVALTRESSIDENAISHFSATTASLPSRFHSLLTHRCPGIEAPLRSARRSNLNPPSIVVATTIFFWSQNTGLDAPKSRSKESKLTGERRNGCGVSFRARGRVGSNAGPLSRVKRW
jgi:hypothetical protein